MGYTRNSVCRQIMPPLDWSAMVRRHGAPQGLCCGTCAHLEPTVTTQRPTRHLRFEYTTLRCAVAQASPWSARYPACGRYQEVRCLD